MNDNLIPYVIFLAVCHVIALLIFIFFIVRFFYFLLRKKTSNRTEKIIAIAITFVIFNKTFQSVILYPTQVLVSNLQKLFYIAYSNSIDSNEIITTKYHLNEQIISVQQILEVFPLSKLIIAFSFLCLTYFTIKFVNKNIEEKRSLSIESLGNASVLIYNSIITIVLVFSLFLVISVCITIPYLNQISKPSSFTVARLDSVLNEYSNKDSFKVVGINKSLFSDPYIKNHILTESADTFALIKNLSSTEKQILNNYIDDFEQKYSLLESERENTINNLNKFSKDYKFKENKYKRSLLFAYEKETPSAIIDKANRFQTVIQYFTYFIDGESDNFYSTLQEIKTSDIQNLSVSDRFVDQMKIAITELAKNNKRDSSYNPYENLNQLGSNFNSYEGFLEERTYPTYVSTLPNDEKAGSEWGIFGYIASYLIKPRSSELVLLMGMFGFGLLGASLLSFQSPSSNGNFINSFKTQPLILNFGDVLARGFGAALVIYLATKGGLAIFSAGSSTDANGYILLLTCFVGAVYSEKVWNKIRISLYGADVIKETTEDKKNDEEDKNDQKLEEKKHDPTEEEKEKKPDA